MSKIFVLSEGDYSDYHICAIGIAADTAPALEELREVFYTAYPLKNEFPYWHHEDRDKRREQIDAGLKAYAEAAGIVCTRLLYGEPCTEFTVIDAFMHWLTLHHDVQFIHHEEVCFE